MVWWRCRSCGDTTNELLSTCNGCGAPRESVAPSADAGYVERTVSEAQPRSAEELRDVAARLLALAEEKEGGAAPLPAPAASPPRGRSLSPEEGVEEEKTEGGVEEEAPSRSRSRSWSRSWSWSWSPSWFWSWSWSWSWS